MITFVGTYFDGGSARPYAASFTCSDRQLIIQGEGNLFYREVPLSECRVDPPLGDTPRSIRLPGGAVCETADSDALVALEKISGRNRGMRLVHFIESRWKMVLLCLAGIICCIWIFQVYAIPFLAGKIASAVPAQMAEALGHQTMEVLDERFLKRSELSGERTEKIRESFQKLLKDIDSGDVSYRLEFRRSPFLGPNAFALPSGVIVMTDELVELSENQRELDGILLHEIAHVTEQHGLRSVIQNAGVFLVIAALFGDLTEISATAASLPTILARSGYSRDFEREADRFAVRYFVRHGWQIDPLKDILRRITRDLPNYPGESVLSSHPVLQDRVKYLEDMAGKKH